MDTLTDLDGEQVSARALGWDARDNDGTEWALFHDDLPALSTLIGTLTVNYVDDPGYTQFVVHGIPVDPGSIVRADYLDDIEVLVAAGTSEGATKAWQSRHHGTAGVLSAKIADAEADGSSIDDVDPETVRHELDDLIDLDPDLAGSDGVGFARTALNSPEVITAHADGLGPTAVLGATWLTDQEFQPDALLVDYLGATGLVDGAGSQVAAEAIRRAAAAGQGVLLEPTTASLPFWTKLGATEDPDGVGSFYHGWTAADTARIAAELDDGLTAAGTTEGAIKAWETIKAKKQFGKDQAAADKAANDAHLAEIAAHYAEIDAAQQAAQPTPATIDPPPAPAPPPEPPPEPTHAQQVAAEANEWAATEAALDAAKAEQAALEAGQAAQAAEEAVQQFLFQQQVAEQTGEPEPVALDPSLVETTKSGKVQLTKEAFTEYLATATADSVPPGPLGAGQKAAITKKLQSQALAADIAELDAIDAAAAKQAKAAEAYAAAHPEYLPGPVSKPPGAIPEPDYVVKPIHEVLAGPKLQTPALDAAEAKAVAEAKVKPQETAPPLGPAPLFAITAQTKPGTGQAPPPPSQAQLTNASTGELGAYIKAATGLEAIYSSKATALAKAKEVTAQHVKDNALLASIGYPQSGLTAREARRAVLRETGERKPTGGPGSGTGVHTGYGAATISNMTRDKLEAIVIHHSGGLTTTASLKNVAQAELEKMAIAADQKYTDTVSLLINHDIPAAQIPHSAHGATQLYLGKSKGLPIKPGSGLVAKTVKPPTKAQQAKAASEAAKAAKKAASDAKKTPAQLAQKPANWGSMTASEKWHWSHDYNLKAKGIYPPGAKNAGASYPLGTHEVTPYPSQLKAAQASAAHLSNLKGSGDGGGAFSSYDKREQAFRHPLTHDEQSAWSSYYGGGYTEMNGCLKRGVGCSHGVVTRNNLLTKAIKDHGSKAPKILFRGKRKGTEKDFARTVGSEYEDPGFGSWAHTKTTPKSFAGWGNSATPKSVMYRVVDSKGIRSAPSGSGEDETILPPGTRFRVLAIHDFTANGLQHRQIDVEVIHKPFG